jgi:hypothetical protein
MIYITQCLGSSVGMLGVPAQASVASSTQVQARKGGPRCQVHG